MAIHVVQYGDSLWKIANQYRVSIQLIAEVNGLPSANQLVPGLALYIPEVFQYRYYRIMPGDTLWQLAVRFRANLNAILQANPGLDPTQLFIGQRIVIPTKIRPQIQTLGFIEPYSVSDFVPRLRNLAHLLTYLAVASYSFSEEGYAYVLLEDTEIVAESNRLGVVPLLLIRNTTIEGFSAELAGTVLANPIYRRNLIVSLLNFIRIKGYAGVSLDLEFIPPQRRSDFITFLTELKTALGNLILHVNVHAKTEDLPTNPIVGAYDYRAIGNAADIVAVMTIDYGYPTGPPDPVAPLWWMEEVTRYAVGLINPKKLQVAFPLYGYDKRVPDNQTSALSVNAAQNLAISTGSVIHFDEEALSPWFRYWRGTDEHIVWFEDIRSYREKYILVDSYNLLGVTYWQLSLPAPQNWAYLGDHFLIV